MVNRIFGASTVDAVIVIPGIMGSTLIDSDSGKTLWGLDRAGWYVSAWVTGHSLNRLAVTEAERAGKVKRIRAVSLLKAPAFAPVLHGIEPYTDLVHGIRRVLRHPDAMQEFPYDWRLSVEHNARVLAGIAEQHLDRWRAHPDGSINARLVLVAHSMGGLIARYFTHVLGGSDLVRATVTLGTPYYGAVKAAYILNCGRGVPVPLPSGRLRRLAKTMPGLHDLLPFYRCVEDGDVALNLSARDVGRLGGDATLAQESLARHDALMKGESGNLRIMVGVEQPTMQSMRLAGGMVTPQRHTCEVDDSARITKRVDTGGDSTVFRRAGSAFGLSAASLPQSHGALAKTPEAIAYVRDVLTNDIAGPPLGMTAIGVDVPDMLPVGQRLDVRVTGTTAAGASCRVFDAFSDRQVAVPPLIQRSGELVASTEFRLQVCTGCMLRPVGVLLSPST